ncbi:MAG: hypothetical protein A2Z14_07080 [Chloroflexi bacterium RBG_16_48_8]|nr:MAG: hypothetical protein A2Z14_07080 [Chloroflexi bacterium RBG_16_48_8]
MLRSSQSFPEESDRVKGNILENLSIMDTGIIPIEPTHHYYNGSESQGSRALQEHVGLEIIGERSSDLLSSVKIGWASPRDEGGFPKSKLMRNILRLISRYVSGCSKDEIGLG